MRFSLPQALPFILAASAVGVAQAQPVQQERGEVDGVYSLVGALDGDATLFAARSGAQSELELHLPLLRGDRVWTRPYGRLAVLMSDRSILALDHDSEVTLAQIAGSPDANDADSLYVLHRGRLGLEVASHLLDSEFPAVDTTNARIYTRQEGRYQVESDGNAWTEVAVLQGFAEVVTQRGSVIVRGGEALVVQGLDDPWIELQNGAGVAATALDEWAAGHRARLAAYSAVDVDGHGSALTRHGQWVDVEERRAWKPEVEDDWQPYSRGRWTDTPAGLYWVARDPWGPLTYHYGSWSMHPGYGWLWYPGAIYAPSHVYWYWGPSYVGWIPRGYYQRHYLGLGLGLRHGLYGWAGGFWDPFNTWIFCPTGYLGYGRGYAYGRSLRRRHPKLARGVITTDTNGIDYRNWRDPSAAQRALLGKRPGRSESELPDVTDFVARRANLHESLQTRLVRADDESGTVTVTGGPSGSSAPGLVGVTAGGARANATTRVSGAGRSSSSGVAVRQAAPGAVRRAGGGVSTTTQPRTAGSVSTDGVEPADPATGIRRAATPQPARVSAGGLAAAPAPTPTTEVKETEDSRAKTPVRAATPRSGAGGIDRSPRPTPARRVLDAIRGREAVPSAPRTAPRTATPSSRRPAGVSTPRAATPTRTRSAPTRATAPKATPTRTRSAPTRATAPKATPTRTRSAPPRATAPRSTPTRTRSAPPRATAPRSTPTRTRSAPPRATAPKSTPTRTRSAPTRATAPKSTPTRTRSAPTRATAPRSTPTRTRSAPPRASTPRSTPTRTRSAPTRATAPRSTPTRTRSAPTRSTPRASSPPPSSSERKPPRLR